MIALPIVLAVLSALGAAISINAGNEGPGAFAFLLLGLVLTAGAIGFGLWAVVLFVQG